MITQQEWESLPPAQQAEAWWHELSQMISEAAATLNYTPGNGQTLVVSGLTTVVGRKGTPLEGSPNAG